MSHPDSPRLPVPAAGTLLAKRTRLAVSTLAVVGISLVFPFPVEGRLWGHIFNLAHAPAFFCTLLAIVGLLDPSAVGLPKRFATVIPMSISRTAAVAALLAVLGLIAEFLQYFAGRNPNLKDVAANSGGLLAAFVWVSGQKTAGVKRYVAGLFTVLIIAVASFTPLMNVSECVRQLHQMPLLASFERPLELGSWRAQNATMTRSPAWSTHGKRSLQVDLQPAQYPGVSLFWPNADWQGYQSFAIDLHNPADRPLPLIIKIQDREHELSGRDPRDRFRRHVLLEPGQVRNIRIAISEIRQAPENRSMRMDQISLVQVFTSNLKVPTTYFVDNLRLE
ncbi:MAG: hypothetical protein GY903_05015 [Fuerstiella sp.]|nr:hypothetical protein [Fuerstiella sp.]MCP4853834.1 hypothetical protein [Fuerstiella sp.]